MMKIAGILLIIFGVAALIYGGFTYTSQKKVLDIGDIHVNRTENHTLPLPPVLGIVAIAGGAGLIYFGVKKDR
jgi:threonine/homoserine/homoserine lactone efflux protein